MGDLQLNENDRDKIWWNLTKEGRFTVKSFYSAMKMEQVNFPQKKKTLKIKVFIWLFVGGKGGTNCQFCDREETIQHLFFDCPMARLLWNIGTKLITESVSK